jgi:hypothetical protein
MILALLRRVTSDSAATVLLIPERPPGRAPLWEWGPGTQATTTPCSRQLTLGLSHIYIGHGCPRV